MSLWFNLLWVGLGGFLGSVTRYGMGMWAQDLLPSWPIGTLLANLFGCFFIGLVSGVTRDLDTPLLSPEARLFLATGFCGGLTTLSSFVNEFDELARSGRMESGGLYLILTLGGAGVAFGAGFVCATVLRPVEA